MLSALRTNLPSGYIRNETNCCGKASKWKDDEPGAMRWSSCESESTIPYLTFRCMVFSSVYVSCWLLTQPSFMTKMTEQGSTAWVVFWLQYHKCQHLIREVSWSPLFLWRLWIPQGCVTLHLTVQNVEVYVDWIIMTSVPTFPSRGSFTHTKRLFEMHSSHVASFPLLCNICCHDTVPSSFLI